MEYAVVLAVVALFLLVFILTGKAEEKKAKRFLRKRLQDQYGAYSDKKYADGRMKSIRSAVGCSEGGFVIDDITWNDLELDRVFQALDFTRSAAGEEALYRWLRTPALEEDTLLKRERHFRFFQTHEEDRLSYLMFMSGVGRTGKYSVYDYLQYLDRLPVQKHLLTGLVDALILLSFFLGIAVSGYFFLLFAALVFYHGGVYIQRKKRVEPYLTTFSYFVRILDCTGKLRGMSKEFLREFETETAEIGAEKQAFSSFRRWSFLALDTDAGDPMDFARILLSYLNMIFHLDLMKLSSMQRVIKEKKELLIKLLQNLGEIEGCVSVAYARAAFSEYAVPEFKVVPRKDAGAVVLEAKDLYHPLLPIPVKNSVCQRRGMLLTGSNASGKSTFLKAVALNALLAQTIHTVCAASYRGCFYRIYSSMALRDSLQQGESYFIVEIKSMKRIFDAANDEKYPVLCVIDEVLRGTNTAERIGAGAALLRSLAEKNVLCFAATHDLELASLLRDCMDNYHFEEMVEGREIAFPYRLTEGSAAGRNAIRLLEAFGFDEALVRQAKELAGGFT